MTTRRPLYLHVGSGKTGTSSLQRGFWKSADNLAAAGVGLPLVGRQEHVQRLLRPLGWRPAGAFSSGINRRALAALGRHLAGAPGDRLLLSNEDLAEAGPDNVSALADVVDDAGLDLHVVLTARDWAKQLPSEWQQFLKHRLTTDYPTFLAQVRDEDGEAAATFRRRQDFHDVAARWGARVTPGSVHVIPVPAKSVDPTAVFRHFAEVVGYDPDVVRVPRADINASFGYVEAEVLRRVNCALDDRLPSYANDYVPAIRLALVRPVLARDASARITLPDEHLDWVRARSRQMVEATLAAGHRFHGDPDSLVAGPDAAAPLPDLDDAAIAEAAIRTLTDFAVKVHERSLRARSG